MNLVEIVNRKDNHNLSDDEALFVIKEYVKIRKGVEITPIIEKRLGKAYAMIQLNMLFEMASLAIFWLKENKFNKN